MQMCRCLSIEVPNSCLAFQRIGVKQGALYNDRPIFKQLCKDEQIMEWYNKPATCHVDGDTITMTAEKETDFWRVTLHDFIKDDGHFYYKTVTGDFVATVKVIGDYAELYDQAGVMVRESDTVWMKCGIEYMEGVQYASAVITRDVSDWSIVTLADNPASIWLQVKRIGSAIEVYYAHDDANYIMIRQGYLSDDASLQVGVMCAAPKGDGFDATFEHLKIEAPSG